MSIINGAVVLAAGMGKRMNSTLPKVMCEVLGKPMIDYVISAASKSCDNLCVVVGYQADVIKDHLGSSIKYALQQEQLGTGHAVKMATEFISDHKNGNILVLCGDNPLMDEHTISNSLKQHIKEKNAVTVITAVLEDPAAYGRIIKENNKIKKIVEFKDANEQEIAIREINSGAYWFDANCLLDLLCKIENQNAQNEYYLTDTIKIALEQGLSVNSFVAESADVVLGANDQEQLKELNERAKIAFGC